MMTIEDDYYYHLGRHQAVIEMNDGVPKSRPYGLTPFQMRDWQQGYDEMADVLNWRRKPVKEERVA